MMTFDLEQFSLVDMLRCGRGVRKAAEGATDVEDAARSIVGYLHAECTTGAGAHSCALIRFYLTIPYKTLDPDLRQFAGALLGEESAGPGMKCLTLLATQGVEPDWSDRRLSRGHQAIPLPSDQIVAQAPMTAQLIGQMGLDVAAIHEADKSIVHELAGKTYNVFHVADGF